MPNVTIYHNPRCSKSQQTLALLQKQQIEPTVIEYLNTPLNMSELKNILKNLGLSARALMHKKESIYSEKQLENPNLSEEALIQAMIEHPILIERPIVLANDQAVIGRPPENILDIL